MKKEICTAIVLAAGQGKRMGTTVQKQYLEIGEKPVLYYSLYAFSQCEFIDEIIVVVGENQKGCIDTISYSLTKLEMTCW